MGWRIVVQPDGKYARFSEVVDHFTHFNLSRKQAVNLCIKKGCLPLEAEQKVARAEAEPARWDDALRILRMIHGQEALEKFLAEQKETQ